MNRSDKALIALSLFAALALRLIVFAAGDNFHGIAAGKVLEALRLLDHPENIRSWVVPAHGPIHMYLIALCVKLFSLPLLVPRLLSFLLGIGLMLPYFKFVRGQFGTGTALLSLFLLAFFPLHVVHSTLSTAETAFVFFLFSGFWFLLKNRESGKVREAVFAGTMLGLASMCRFEGALFIIFAVGFIRPEARSRVAYLFCAGILPTLWLSANLLLFGDPMFFLKASDTVVKYEFSQLKAYGEHVTTRLKLFYWPACMFRYFGLIPGLIGFAGLVAAFWRREAGIFRLMFVGLLAVFVMKTLQQELALQPRYGISLGLLFIPFIAHGALRFSRVRCGRGLIAALLLLMVVRGSYNALRLTPRAPSWLKPAARFLSQRMDKKDGLIFLDCDDDNFKEPFKLVSGIPVNRFADFEGYGTHVELIEPEARNKVRYLVLISKERALLNHRKLYGDEQCRIYERAQ